MCPKGYSRNRRRYLAYRKLAPGTVWNRNLWKLEHRGIPKSVGIALWREGTVRFRRAYWPFKPRQSDFDISDYGLAETPIEAESLMIPPHPKQQVAA